MSLQNDSVYKRIFHEDQVSEKVKEMLLWLPDNSEIRKKQRKNGWKEEKRKERNKEERKERKVTKGRKRGKSLSYPLRNILLYPTPLYKPYHMSRLTYLKYFWKPNKQSRIFMPWNLFFKNEGGKKLKGN